MPNKRENGTEKSYSSTLTSYSPCEAYKTSSFKFSMDKSGRLRYNGLFLYCLGIYKISFEHFLKESNSFASSSSLPSYFLALSFIFTSI